MVLPKPWKTMKNAIRTRLGEPYLLTAYQNMRLAKAIKTTQASKNITL